jgi:enoyl-CoA hydratase/carnithine racemase
VSRVALEIDGAVAWLRIENPSKLNAFTAAMLAELEDHCAALERAETVRGVILCAAPARAFCAGADIAEWGAMAPAEFARHWVRAGHRAFDRLARLSKPVVAALGGHAFGGGLELAACADIRVMHPAATLALPEAQVGIVPGWSGTQRLARLLPEPVLKEMALFGRRIPAERALALGFVAELSETPEALARQLVVALDRAAPRAVEVAKYLIHAGAGEDAPALVEALAAGMVGASADKAEGVAAFAAKRTPNFTGS